MHPAPLRISGLIFEKDMMYRHEDLRQRLAAAHQSYAQITTLHYAKHVSLPYSASKTLHVNGVCTGADTSLLQQAKRN
jgi:hypothetical protein